MKAGSSVCIHLNGAKQRSPLWWWTTRRGAGPALHGKQQQQYEDEVPQFVCGVPGVGAGGEAVQAGQHWLCRRHAGGGGLCLCWMSIVQTGWLGSVQGQV